MTLWRNMRIARVHSFCLRLMCNQGGSGPLQPAVRQLLCSLVGPVTDSAAPVNDLKDVTYLTLSDKFAEFSSLLHVSLSPVLLNSFRVDRREATSQRFIFLQESFISCEDVDPELLHIWKNSNRWNFSF